MSRGIRLSGWPLMAVCFSVVIAIFAACLGTSPLPPRAPGEPAPQIVVATESDQEPLASCGGVTFPAAVVDEPIGPDDQLESRFEGVPETLREFPSDLRVPADAIWRLAVENAGRATFLTEVDGDWFYATVTAAGAGWRLVNMGDCQLHSVVSEQLGAAAWWLDERLPPPTAESIDLPVLLLELECASGSFATGRIASPLVRYSAESVVIIAAVRVIGGTCPMNPATPAVFILPEPIGNRLLLDGYHIPPAPPSRLE